MAFNVLHTSPFLFRKIKLEAVWFTRLHLEAKICSQKLVYFIKLKLINFVV